MNSDPLPDDPTFLPASLAASSVGTWEYDVGRDRLRYCRAMAALYGLPPDQGAEGVPMERIHAKTHPDDRALSYTKREGLFRHGGAFVFEHRIVPSPLVTRWVLVRGFYELGPSGEGIQGRGVVVDVTEGRGDDEAGVFFLTDADDDEVMVLDRVTKHVLAGRRALDELEPTSVLHLRSAADMLLLELARHIAGTLVPVVAGRTQH